MIHPQAKLHCQLVLITTSFTRCIGLLIDADDISHFISCELLHHVSLHYSSMVHVYWSCLWHQQIITMHNYVALSVCTDYFRHSQTSRHHLILKRKKKKEDSSQYLLQGKQLPFSKTRQQLIPFMS